MSNNELNLINDINHNSSFHSIHKYKNKCKLGVLFLILFMLMMMNIITLVCILYIYKNIPYIKKYLDQYELNVIVKI